MSTILEAPITPALLGPTLADDLAAIVAAVKPSVVLIGQNGGHGAGVIWRSEGIIVTNRHVLRDDRVDVIFDDGRRLTGIVAARHPHHDLAVVKVAAEGLPAVRLGDSSTVRPGQIAIAIGHPQGMRSAATMGIIVAAGQAATLEGPRTGDWIQTDLTLRPGNSGGPLIDAHGAVIGINTMVSGRLALSIPSSAVERLVAGEHPGDPRAWLGLDGLVVPLRLQDHDAGFLLSAVAEGSPADRAGLIVGDVIVAIGGKPVIDAESVPAAVMRLVPGQAVEVDILRGGEPRRFTVVPTERR
ncbi:MAG: trypsin-like peptidase domain-containing protein [Thermomicrobiales bacterium]